MIQTEAIQFRTADGITYVIPCNETEPCEIFEKIVIELGLCAAKSARYIEDGVRPVLLVETSYSYASQRP